MSISLYARNEYMPDAGNSWNNMFELVPEGSRVLDVGCSSGNFGAALQERRGCSVVGIDINPEDVALAREKLDAAHVLDVTDPSALADLGTFDVIVVADVLEHLVDPRSALQGLRASLREGGRVVFSIPHMGHLSIRLDMLEGRFPYTDLGLLDRTHIHFYDRIEVHDVFARAGFAIQKSSPVLADYPESWIDARLAEIGLSATPVFHAVLRRTDAQVYQYVGTAIPSETAPLRTPTAQDLTSPPDVVATRASELIAQNAAIREELTRLTVENRFLIRDLALAKFADSPRAADDQAGRAT